jgi:hypothetical protein
MKKALIPLAAGLSAALSPLSAFAQGWIANPDYAEGIGIRVGNLEFHPSAGAEFGYDSNYFRASEEEGVVDLLRLRATLSATLSTLGPERRNAATPPDVAFSSGAHISYNEFLPLDSADAAARKQRGLAGGVRAHADFWPRGRVGFDLHAAYLRTLEADGSSDDLTSEGFNRGTARAGTGVKWRPGGGLFEWRLGYAGSFNHFDDDDFNQFRNWQHEINTRGRWRFLPRSALLFDSAYHLVRYSDEATQQTDGDSVRARIGFNGLITYHFALLGLLGWASSFYESRPGALVARQYDSLIANAELRWFLMPRPDLDAATVASGLSSIALGYTRSFSNSYYGSFYQRDRGYLQFNMFLLGAVVGGLEFGVSRIGYPLVQVNGFEQPAFDQVRLDGKLFAEYRFTDTIATNATFLYDQVSGSADVNNENLDYTRWQAFIGLRWFM